MSTSSSSLVSRRERVAALVLLLVFFAFGLFDHALWSANDSREGAMVREMFRHNRWVVPEFNAKPYLEKPPLLHWTALVICKTVGTVNEGLVRLPAALYGLGAVLITYLWAREMGRERAGLAAAFLCATSALYVEYSRIVLTDAALTFMVMLSLYLFWRAYTAPGPAVGRHGLFVLVSALAFYAKGLLGPGLVWTAVCAFLAYRRQWRRLAVLVLVFVPVFALVLAPWVLALWRKGGRDMLVTVFWANQFGRFLSFDDPTLPLDPYRVHKYPVWYYGRALPARLAPWTLLVLPALVHWFRRRSPVQGPLPAFLRVALGAMVLVLHLSSAKAACYLMPLFPLLFLMTAVWLEDAAGAWRSRIERGLIVLTFVPLAFGLVLVPMLFMAGVLLTRSRFAALLPAIVVRWLWAPGEEVVAACFAAAALAAGAALVAVYRLATAFRQGSRPAILLTAPAVAAVLFLLNVGAAFPLYDYHRTYQPLAELALEHARQGRRIALVGAMERDCGQLMFYMNRGLDVLSVSNNPAEYLDAGPGPAGVILPRRRLAEVLERIGERPFRLVRCRHEGYKSGEFLLLLPEEAEPPDPAPPVPRV